MDPTEEYQALIETMAVDVATLVTDERGTLGGTRPQLDEVELDASLPQLVLAGPDDRSGARADLELKHTIGRGSTATVWAAAQPSLRRTVAVKQLNPERNDPGARALLLQEARITGALEHPHIVPVHALGLDEGGSPLLIMKYIEGTPWRTSVRALYDPDEPAPDAEVERQLQILLAVTRAVHFAHSRGILHRDLKPDNVMLGADEEVYVVDWGLAVTLEAGVDLPLAADVSSIAGTPGYMAPEMAASAGPQFGPRTDVYLLGAILHELITGRRRHEAETVIERLAAAYRSEPHVYDDGVPTELAQTCNRACHKDPAQRFADALAFRHALEDFLRHRGSRALALEADQRLRWLEQVDEPPVDARSENSVAPATWNTWSTEARFGYRQALREWPENEAARRGLQALLTLLIRRELRRDNPKTAAELASELPEPSPALQAEIQDVERRVRVRQRDARAAAEMRHDQDPAVGARIRRRISYVNGLSLLLVAGTLFAMRITGFREPGYPDLMVATLIVAATMHHGGRKITEAEGANWVNRQLFGGIVRIALAIAILFGLGWLGDMNIVHVEATAMLMCSLGSLLLGSNIDRGLLWASAGFALTAVGVLLWPQLRGAVIAVGGLASFVATAIAWRNLDRSTG